MAILTGRMRRGFCNRNNASIVNIKKLLPFVHGICHSCTFFILKGNLFYNIEKMEGGKKDEICPKTLFYN